MKELKQAEREAVAGGFGEYQAAEVFSANDTASQAAVPGADSGYGGGAVVPGGGDFELPPFDYDPGNGYHPLVPSSDTDQ